MNSIISKSIRAISKNLFILGLYKFLAASVEVACLLVIQIDIQSVSLGLAEVQMYEISFSLPALSIGIYLYEWTLQTTVFRQVFYTFRNAFNLGYPILHFQAQNAKKHERKVNIQFWSLSWYFSLNSQPEILNSSTYSCRKVIQKVSSHVWVRIIVFFWKLYNQLRLFSKESLPSLRKFSTFKREQSITL